MIKIGVVGTSDLAHIHVVGLLSSSRYDLVGCYSPDNRQSMVFAREYRSVSYSSIDALFKYVDAVDITDHFPETMALAEKSLKALKHVFITQPYRLNAKQMRYLKKLAEESGVVLQMGTGYRFCPVYNKLSEMLQTAMVVDVRHQLSNSSGLNTLLYVEQAYISDFLTSLLNTNIKKLDAKAFPASDGSPDMLHCRIDCDNGCVVNLLTHSVAGCEPKLEITFTSPEAVIRADIFKSVIEKQCCATNAVERYTLEAYCEKTVQQHYLRIFHRAICNDLDALRDIERLDKIIVVIETQYRNLINIDD